MKLQLLSIMALPEVIALLSFLNPSVCEETLRLRYEKILREYPNYLVLGAYIDGRLAGLTGIWHGTKIWCGDYMEVDNLVVHPEYRARGVGTALVQRVEQMAREKGCNIVVLDSYTNNHPSHRLYHRMGCEIWGFHFVKPLGDFEH
jgi:GNAT superfamily N-acetyltransferase